MYSNKSNRNTNSLCTRGKFLVDSGDWQNGLKMILESIDELRKSDDVLADAHALFEAAQAYEITSDLDNARLYYRDALRLYDHLKNQVGVAKSNGGLGSVLVCQGHYEKGMYHLTSACESYRTMGRFHEVAEIEGFCQKAKIEMASVDP